MHKSIISIAIIACLFSCSNNEKIPNYIDKEITLLKDKTILAVVEIREQAKRYPERYSHIHNHSNAINDAVLVLDSLIKKDLKVEYVKEFSNLKERISKSKLYRGSWIFDLMKTRFHHLENPDLVDKAQLNWHLINFEYELQNYLLISLNDDYLIFTNVWPFVVEDSIILMTSNDTNLIQNIHIWDIEKSENLYHENKDDDNISQIEITNGKGKISPNQLLKYPNGYQGFFKIETKRGDGNYYWFSNAK